MSSAKSFLQEAMEEAARMRNEHERETRTNFGVVIVPQQEAYIVERFGKYHKTLSPGLHFLIPFIDRISYVHSLKEVPEQLAQQTAITRDNVTITIDGVLYMKVVDPYKASYGVDRPKFALRKLAQTTMRSELGKITLDKTFEERDMLNSAIVKAINTAADDWGMTCLRYEIQDIVPPPNVKSAMELQAEAERRKRAQILESEGARQSEINLAEGNKQRAVLEAEGDAAAIYARAQATAKGIEVLADTLKQPGGKDAVSLRIAEQYINAFGNLAKKGNTMLLPSNTGDIGSMVAQALSVYKNINASQQGSSSSRSAGINPYDEDLPLDEEDYEYEVMHDTDSSDYDDGQEEDESMRGIGVDPSRGTK